MMRTRPPTESATQVAGPGVGGMIAQLLTAAGGLALDVISFLVSAACLWRIKPRYVAVKPVGAKLRLGAQIREGVAFVRSDRYLSWLIAIGASPAGAVPSLDSHAGCRG